MLIRATDYTLTIVEQIALAEANLRIFEAEGAITQVNHLRKRIAKLRKLQEQEPFRRRRKPHDEGWL